MEVVETTLPSVGFEALIRSHRDGDVVVVSVGGMVFAERSRDNLPTRDLFLVAGHQSGFEGTFLARLAGVSEAQVSRVLARFASHGWSAARSRRSDAHAPPK